MTNVGSRSKASSSVQPFYETGWYDVSCPSSSGVGIGLNRNVNEESLSMSNGECSSKDSSYSETM